MDKNAFFWQVQAGNLPPPAAAQTLGINIISIDSNAGSIDVEFDGKAEFTNPAGKIQGGFLAAMLDDTMGPALASMLQEGEFAPTLDLHVQFLRAAYPGNIQGTGRVVRRGSKVCFLAGELRQQGQLVASATATAIIHRAKIDKRQQHPA